MEMINEKSIQIIKILILSITLSLMVGFASAQPAGNVEEVLNVGPDLQIKNGALASRYLTVFNGAIIATTDGSKMIVGVKPPIIFDQDKGGSENDPGGGGAGGAGFLNNFIPEVYAQGRTGGNPQSAGGAPKPKFRVYGTSDLRANTSIDKDLEVTGLGNNIFSNQLWQSGEQPICVKFSGELTLCP